MRAVLSVLAVSTSFPSGLKTAEFTALVCPTGNTNLGSTCEKVIFARKKTQLVTKKSFCMCIEKKTLGSNLMRSIMCMYMINLFD